MRLRAPSLVRGATLDPDGRREPPAGGAFVVIEATGLPEPMASTPLLVSTGGKEYPVSVSAPRMAVAVSTDGRDARVGVGYDGLVQWIDVASGKRVGHIPRGYYDTIADAVDTACPDLAPATMSVGFRRVFGDVSRKLHRTKRLRLAHCGLRRAGRAGDHEFHGRDGRGGCVG